MKLPSLKRIQNKDICDQGKLRENVGDRTDPQEIKPKVSRVKWYMPVILALGRVRQERVPGFPGLHNQSLSQKKKINNRLKGNMSRYVLKTQVST
jgi:hypothetical protein